MKQEKLEPFVNKTITVTVRGAFYRGTLQPITDDTITLIGIYAQKKETKQETVILTMNSIDGIILDGDMK
jgi:hypothetical protein